MLVRYSHENRVSIRVVVNGLLWRLLNELGVGTQKEKRDRERESDTCGKSEWR